MKQVIIILGLCFLLIGMPIGLSDCGCDQKNPGVTYSNLNNTPPLSAADINTLRVQGQQEGWTFTVAQNPATNYSLNQLCGLVVPDNWQANANFDPITPTRDLPSKYDWRDITGCPAIRDQGACGSCWAFSSIGALECGIMINESKDVDLSEQWLVSCNRDNWGCQGGWFASDYLQWKTDSCGGTGAVPEDAFPYVAENAPCNCPYPHDYKLNRWAYIGDDSHIPSVDSIKTAIMTYGPVSVALGVTSAFQGYSGGVFNQNDPNVEINHAGVLVGWDDSQGAHGVWFFRNSWGSWWGEDGYMRIEYGCNKIGYGANYIDKYTKIAQPPRTNLGITITGGIGITIDTQNMGVNNATDVNVNTTISGGLLGLVNFTLTETNPQLKPNDGVNQHGLAFGLGSIKISVVATASNANKVTSESTGILIGIFVIITKK